MANVCFRNTTSCFLCLAISNRATISTSDDICYFTIILHQVFKTWVLLLLYTIVASVFWECKMELCDHGQLIITDTSEGALVRCYNKEVVPCKVAHNIWFRNWSHTKQKQVSVTIRPYRSYNNFIKQIWKHLLHDSIMPHLSWKQISYGRTWLSTFKTQNSYRTVYVLHIGIFALSCDARVSKLLSVDWRRSRDISCLSWSLKCAFIIKWLRLLFKTSRILFLFQILSFHFTK